MANPQKENGYTAIANEIMEALMKYRIPGEKMQVLLCVIRMTYGFVGRRDVELSNNKIAQLTGLKRQNVIRSLSWLESKLILSRIKTDSKRTNTLKFNKDFDGWLPFEKKPVRIKSDAKVRIKSDAEGQITPIIFKTIKTKQNFFEIFWSAYPVKKSKKKAKDIFQRLLKKGLLPENGTLISAIESQKKEKSALMKAGKFCPEWKHPTTWLNQGCWEDEPQVEHEPQHKYYTGEDA